ncbi:hypothetical protein [Falsiroseomonas tokyonensis]|uniref:Uncharacterized protein n=1 Tax=Falsiroseomonas tokyonensis TaxID=430521 RepID=A0ABV7C0J7_9PROT|nr:hypothetical protein [Falsiroseomonas tokyonensis]MBU8541334.1 hypothetical protein [Falsiroseomonas tokyonensis]
MSMVSGGFGAPPLPPAITIRSAAELRWLSSQVKPGSVLLLSAPGAAGFLGPLAWRALVALAPGFPDALCCGAAAGDALAALRAGCRRIVLEGGCPAFASLCEAAGETGALVLPVRPPALDLQALDLRRPFARAKLTDWCAKAAAPAHDTAPSLR